MKTAKQLIEDELQKTIHQLKEVSLLQGGETNTCKL